MKVVMLLLTYLQKICVPNETKSVNVKLFNMITKIIETKH